MIYRYNDHITVLGKVWNSPEKEFSCLAYLIQGKKNILIDDVPVQYGEEFLCDLNSIMDLKKIDILIQNHTEGDHSGSLERLLHERPDLPVYCTENARKRLMSRFPDADYHTVADKETQKIGDYTFTFIHMPGMHWDDNMVTYLHEDKILFSNDLFGQYLGAETPLDDEYSAVMALEKTRQYFVNVFGLTKESDRRKLSDVLQLDIKTIAPAHGVILQGMRKPVLDLYKAVCLPDTDS